MDKDKKKMLVGAGIIGGIGLAYLLMRKAEGPPPDRANLYGVVSDAQTGHAIQGIEVSFNGYLVVTESDGYYLIEIITPGEYALTFYDPLGRYETLIL